jgi:transposase
MFLTAGQRSHYIGARALLDGLPSAEHMLADRGYDADWYREALEDKGITPCIPSRRGRTDATPHDANLYRKPHKIETIFARLNDWRRVATRYDRCAKLMNDRPRKTLGWKTPAQAFAEEIKNAAQIAAIETLINQW